MTRHIADRRLPSTGDKTRAFLDIARKETPHPAVVALTRQPRGPRNGEKTTQFLRIERGQTA
ncbi:MAG: hypothetical protein ACK4S2_08665 [Gemmobacter sp.]|uniref:hypothetical protein n=1 Tax=Gemmobacter sp. TaxID=1898957 RepID=UPI00391C06D6